MVENKEILQVYIIIVLIYPKIYCDCLYDIL